MAANQSIDLKPHELKLFQELMYTHAGVKLSDAKHLLVQNRLRKRVERLGLGSFKQYFEMVSNPDNADELRECLNALTTNETYFFRHKDHWDYLGKVIVPEWMESNHANSVFRVWSAAASIGAEAYSAALMLHELMPGNCGRGFEIDATDINQNVLDKAKKAEFDEYALQKMGERGRKSYFTFSPEHKSYSLSRAIADRVRFRRLNLLETSKGAPYDVVFLRNVLIYFDDASKAQVIMHVNSRMRQGSYLFLGGAETLSVCREAFEIVKPTILRKR